MYKLPEKIIIGLCVAVLAISGYLFMRPTSEVAQRPTAAVAQIAEIQKDVRVKYQEEIAWRWTHRHQNLSLGDSVYAGPQSTAKISFQDGGSVEVGENSLVIVSLNREVSLSYGRLTAHLEKDKPLIVVSHGKRIKVAARTEGQVLIRHLATGMDVRPIGRPLPQTLLEIEGEPTREIGNEILEVQIDRPEQPTTLRRLANVPPPSPEPSAPENVIEKENVELEKAEPENVEPPPPAKKPKALAKKKIAPVPRAIAAATPSPPRAPTSKPKVSLDIKNTAPEDFSTDRTFWISIGGGFNYFDFAQNSSTEPKISYASVASPSVALHSGYETPNGHGLEFSLSNEPGEIRANSVEIDRTKYQWRTASLEGIAQVLRPYSIAGNSLRGRIRFGAQYHELPYLLIDEDRLFLGSQKSIAASLGFEGLLLTGKRWRSQVYLRYQQPLGTQSSTTGKLTTSPQFAFDGSLGSSYYLSPRWDLGLYWHGQWQQFNYRLTNDSLSDSGSQKLFFSSVELRLGFSVP